RHTRFSRDWSSDVCSSDLIGLVPYSPLGKGYLTGKIDENTKFEGNDFRNIIPRFTTEAIKANKVLVELLNDMANKKEATPAQIEIGRASRRERRRISASRG